MIFLLIFHSSAFFTATHEYFFLSRTPTIDRMQLRAIAIESLSFQFNDISFQFNANYKFQLLVTLLGTAFICILYPVWKCFILFKKIYVIKLNTHNTTQWRLTNYFFFIIFSDLLRLSVIRLLLGLLPSRITRLHSLVNLSHSI